MINSHRQRTGIETVAPDEMVVGKPGGLVEPGVRQYGIFKKIKKGVKKIFKSKLGKAALLGLGAYGLGGAGFLGGKGIFAAGQGLQRFKNLANIGGALKSGMFGKAATNVAGLPITQAGTGGLWGGIKKFGLGKSALLGLGAAGAVLPFMGNKPPEEEEDDWLGVDKIRQMARDRHPSLAFLPPEASVQQDWYTNPSPFNQGGIVGLANGGQPAEAQAEQMLKMEYQKYRNQGGTMSYQQFKMAVLQQAQGQGPMAQEQPQMAAYGGRMGYENGELVEDASMVEETPTGMMEEDVEEVQGEPTREQMEALAMEIFQLRLEELDEEQLMIVYQAAMEQQPKEVGMQEEDIQFDPQMSAPQMAAYGGRIGLLGGGPVPESTVPGYTTPSGYNQFDYPSGGVRVGRAEGGIMDLGGMEKDYRAEGGFVPIGAKEKADDVPARLSKNEFVFTADAVRNAGGGDIDAGADVMQNMMENLEQGGEISEESQGAQDMYDQQQMLQSRMV